MNKIIIGIGRQSSQIVTSLQTVKNKKSGLNQKLFVLVIDCIEKNNLIRLSGLAKRMRFLTVLIAIMPFYCEYKDAAAEKIFNKISTRFNRAIRIYPDEFLDLVHFSRKEIDRLYVMLTEANTNSQNTNPKLSLLFSHLQKKVLNIIKRYEICSFKRRR